MAIHSQGRYRSRKSWCYDGDSDAFVFFQERGEGTIGRDMSAVFSPGIVHLVGRNKEWIAGQRVGLLSHQPAIDRLGRTSAELLWQNPDVELRALLGPEHGYFGLQGAGERTGKQRHPDWGIPIYSLYGRHRKPTESMLKGLDVLVVDLQDLGARPYTYVSTLRLALEAAAESGTRVVVADRPIPLPHVIDGPVLDSDFRSFVGLIDTPMAYGMTPGETALWLQHQLGLELDVKIARMRGYEAEAGRGIGWPPWIPPSPGIRSWESAMCYLATVFCEAIPAIDCGRSTNLSFQLVGSPWMKVDAVLEQLGDLSLSGVAFRAHRFTPQSGPYVDRALDGMRLVVTNPRRFHPVATAVAILSVLQSVHGRRRVWRGRGVRPGFFDALFGTDSVRHALMDGEPGPAVARGWRSGLRTFAMSRSQYLQYQRPT